ncbi:MAG: lipopolysaccharide heptosyltransferase II [Bryobacteraceae bacterium]
MQSQPRRILVRATNWVGDAVLSLPALGAIRDRFPDAHIAVLARPWVAGLYRHEPFADEIIPYQPAPFRRGSLLSACRDRTTLAAALRAHRFDCALLLQNAFDAALIAALAGIPERIGYARDLRSPLLTRPIVVPRPGAIPPHESFYYLELLRRAGWLDRLPGSLTVELRSAPRARAAGLARFAAEGIDTPLIGVSPGAAFGSAKRWLPERFAASACTLAQRLGATVALHGSASERDLCESVCAMIAQHGIRAVNYAGRTTLEEFIERAAASRLFLTNDSGAMHIASALGVPTVAVSGPTNPDTTGPAGPLARIVRNPVECAPCLLRVCPIDHRCMTRVQHETVSHAALDLIQMAVEWTPDSK